MPSLKKNFFSRLVAALMITLGLVAYNQSSEIESNNLNEDLSNNLVIANSNTL